MKAGEGDLLEKGPTGRRLRRRLLRKTSYSAKEETATSKEKVLLREAGDGDFLRKCPTERSWRWRLLTKMSD